MMKPEEIQKQHAIETHSLQASEFATSYQELEQDAYRSCFTYSRRRLEMLLERYLPARGSGMRLLDVGCGTGHHLASLRARGFAVAGVDGSEEMLIHARANNPGAEIKHSDVERLPFQSGSFDYVICIEVLRYLPSLERCVHEIARVLKPGGVCLATAAPVFNLNGYFLINRLATAMPVGNLVRLKQFFTTSGQLRHEFRAAGFAEPAVHGVYIGPLNWFEHLMPTALPSLLKFWEPIDARLADSSVLREFSNMFLVKAIKKKF